MSYLDFKCLYTRLKQSNETKLKHDKVTHDKKLQALGIPNKHNHNKDKTVINLSNKILNDSELEALSLGLSFALPKRNIKFVDHFLAFENLVNNLKYLQCKPKDWGSMVKEIASVAHSSFRDFNIFKRSFPKLPQTLYDSLIKLKSDKSIIITRPDKGRGTVVMNKDDYISKVEQILSDTSKFKVITEGPFQYITKLEDKLARLLRQLLKLNVITKNTFNRLFTSGSSPGILYGLPKTHKLGNPIRPILSTLNTFNYKVAKYLVPILEPLTSNEFTLKNSYDFVKEIKTLEVANTVMASFDIKSLFTQIPLDETIQIICGKLFKDNDSYLNYTKKQFTNLLNLAIKDSPFLFNKKLYAQTDGISMGSCLGPTLANAFLCHHETNWLNECPLEFKPKFYRRYVDDTFLIFENSQHIPKFLNYLNSKHANIEFTCDMESDGSIPFLDVLVTRTENKLHTTVYRKPTFTGLGINYLSFIPQLFKVNAIKTLLYRCYALSSDWISFDQEIKFLTTFFHNNGFPLEIINNNIYKFLNNKFNLDTPDNSQSTRKKYIKLPFYGHLSYIIRNKLANTLRVQYPDIKFMFVFTNSFSITSFFKSKDSVPNGLVSNVIYEFTCSSCKARYIGETTRNLTHRINEHKGRSIRTNKQLSNPAFSAIRSHAHSQDHPFSDNDFSILHRVDTYTDIRTAEAVYIKHLKPELNHQNSSNNLYLL